MRDAVQIAKENLTLWHETASENRELRLLQATELGRLQGEAWRSGGHEEGAAALSMPWPALENSPLVSSPDAFARALGTEEQIAFCRGFMTAYPLPLFEEEPSLPSPPASPRVAMMDSVFGREALRALAALLPHARPLFAHSFGGVCEALADDRADFALLPMEDSHEGRLSRLAEEADRFELHVTHTCNIPYPDEGRSVTMALLAKRYTPRGRVTGERMLSCSILEEDTHTLPDLLYAAVCCGLSLHRVDASPAPWGEGGVVYLPVFRTSGGDPALFLTYLAIRHPRARITGRYLHVQ